MNQLKKTNFKYDWYVDGDGDIRLHPETGHTFDGWVCLEKRDLVTLLKELGCNVAEGNIIIENK